MPRETAPVVPTSPVGVSDDFLKKTEVVSANELYDAVGTIIAKKGLKTPDGKKVFGLENDAMAAVKTYVDVYVVTLVNEVVKVAAKFRSPEVSPAHVREATKSLGWPDSTDHGVPGDAISNAPVKKAISKVVGTGPGPRFSGDAVAAMENYAEGALTSLILTSHEYATVRNKKKASFEDVVKAMEARSPPVPTTVAKDAVS